MGLTKRAPSEGGSGGGRGHSAMEHWQKTADIKDAARQVRRRNDRELVSEGGLDCFEPVLTGAVREESGK